MTSIFGYVLFATAGLVLLLSIPLIRELIILHKRVSTSIRNLESRPKESTQKDNNELAGALINEQLGPNAPASPSANVRLLKAATTDAPSIQESFPRALRIFQAIETAAAREPGIRDQSANDPKLSDEKPPLSNIEAALAMVQLRADVDKPSGTLEEDDDFVTLTSRGHWLPERARG